MGLTGWYYLHENGSMIYKRDLPGTAADIRESPFAKGLWSLDVESRADAWKICVEGLAAGARPERIKELANKWQCDDEDAESYAGYLGIIIGQDGNQKTAHKADFIDLQNSPCGFGDTYLDAMTDLAKQLGYKPSKMWGTSFADLVGA